MRIILRQHARKPGFAITVICILALALGATTAVLSVVNAVLVRGLPFASPDRLVWVSSVRPDGPNAPFTLPEFLDYRGRTRTLSGLAAYANWSAGLAGGDGVTEILQGARMSANIFDVLGMRPAAGRLFDERDDRADAPLVVVLSYRLWWRQYGASKDVIGRPLRINGQSYVAIGVTPAHFPLPLRDIDLITPLAPDRDPLRNVRNSTNFLRFIGRLESSAERSQAQAELTTICRSLKAQFPVEYARKEAVRVIPLQDVIVADYRDALLVLLAAVFLVLGTALANLTALALVRANDRRAELLMRLAIGASRWHLARPLIADGVMLAVAGSGVAWIIATQLIALVPRLAPASTPRIDEVGLDVTAMLFVLAATVITAMLLTAAPLRAVSRARAQDVALLSSRGAIGDRLSIRLRNVMVVAQIAAALVLLLATYELARNLRQLSDVDLGFKPDGVFQVRVSIPSTYRTSVDISRFYDLLNERLVSTPGVERVGVVSIAPLSGLLYAVPFTVEGQAVAPGERAMANLRAISPGYLSVMGTSLVHGRAFAETDRASSPHVAIVSAALAERFLGSDAVGTVDAVAAVGRRLLINDNNTGPRPVEIVGVVENVRQAALDLPPALDIYLPLSQIHPDGLAFLRSYQFWMVKTASDAAAFGGTFQAQLRATDPDAAVSNPGPMERAVDGSLGPRRFNLALIGGFALTAVLLTVVGLHGLVAYVVSQRTSEIGLRLAIGASTRDVQWMILRQAGGLGIAGALGGLALASILRLFATRVIAGVSFSPVAAAASGVLIIAVAVLAAWGPARRAARIEPSVTLKSS